MVVSESKSVFFAFGLELDEKEKIQGMFPFQFKEIDTRFMYLGFFFKSNNYKKEDLYWLLRKI